MDSSNVLLALEEQKKWRERRKRIRERIHQLDRRRSTLRKELEGIRSKIVAYSRIFVDQKIKTRARPTLPPTSQGR